MSFTEALFGEIDRRREINKAITAGGEAARKVIREVGKDQPDDRPRANKKINPIQTK